MPTFKAMIVNDAMKTTRITFLLLGLLSACGQPGPLYLPTDKPPVYVAPDKESKAQEEAPKAESDPKADADSTEKSKPQEVPQATDTPPKAE
jgi:predicted small lipoprotein YifL